jgi:hypothetical protein
MKNQTLTADEFESTYALIVRSEDRERSIFEGAVYVAVVLSALFSLWQFAKQPVDLPLTSVHTTAITHSADLNHRA